MDKPSLDGPDLPRRRCQAIGTGGKPCGMAPIKGGEWCFQHDPSRAVERTEARRKGGQRGNRARSGPVGEPVPLRTVDQIMTVLEQAAGDAMQLDNSAERCRVLTSLAGQALKALEVGELEARLEALEQRANLGRAA